MLRKLQKGYKEFALRPCGNHLLPGTHTIGSHIRGSDERCAQSSLHLHNLNPGNVAGASI
jgi:hypothetical protein